MIWNNLLAVISGFSPATPPAGNRGFRKKEIFARIKPLPPRWEAAYLFGAEDAYFDKSTWQPQIYFFRGERR
jgi:hypothetical protein